MSVKNEKDFRVLSIEESKNINGGTSQSSANMALSSSADSLLSIEFNWQQGDQSRHYKIEAGKDVDLSLNLNLLKSGEL